MLSKVTNKTYIKQLYRRGVFKESHDYIIKTLEIMDNLIKKSK